MDELVQSVTDNNCPQPWRGCGAGSGIYGAANLAIRLRMSSKTQSIHELRNRVRYTNQFQIHITEDGLIPTCHLPVRVSDDDMS